MTIWFAEKAGPVSYYIKGSGISPAPAFTGKFSVQESVDGTNFTDLKVFTTASPAPGGTMGAANKFVHTPAAASRYVRFFYTSKLSGSNIALDSVLIKAAPAGTTPAIVVKQGTNTVINGGLYSLGNTSNTNFTIFNGGTSQSLNIDSIRFSGPAAGDYSVASPPSSVAASGSAPMAISFSPGANGSRKAVMKIYNNDPEKNPYTINLYGIGGNLATEPAGAPANLSLNDVKPFGFRIAFNASADAERYIVLRKTSGNLTETPVDGQSYRVGEYIGAAQVAYIGDSATSTLRPNYILANTEYQVQSFAFNGPAGFENYLTSAAANNVVTTNDPNFTGYYAGVDVNSPAFVSQLTAALNPANFFQIYYSN
jgi:hypothetical protein